jgi:hypothetical protein
VVPASVSTDTEEDVTILVTVLAAWDTVVVANFVAMLVTVATFPNCVTSWTEVA